MKTKIKSIFTALIAMFFTSCATTFYQVYKAIPSEKMIVSDNSLIYEDVYCKVIYNLWSEGGNVGFVFYNKTDSDIFLNLEKSFFILNGVSYDYYKDRTYTNSISRSATSISSSSSSSSVTGMNYSDLIQTNRLQATSNLGIMGSVANSISFNEKKIISIPSKTSKFIDEYIVTESLYRDCDLLKYPTPRQTKSKTFTRNDSPFVFSNIITYSVSDSKDLIRFENEFYVTEISNHVESEMFKHKFDEYCGQKSMKMTKYFKNVSADKFYIKYAKNKDFWEH
jgi:hypothetical protein